jgi:CubicO group peptidase (beta-lactamase class C family)
VGGYSAGMTTALRRLWDGIADETEFSGVVQVSRGSKLLYERASGFADRAHGIDNTVETRFGIASGCKGFTALVVMSLIKTGRSTSARPYGACLATTWNKSIRE